MQYISKSHKSVMTKRNVMQKYIVDIRAISFHLFTPLG